MRPTSRDRPSGRRELRRLGSLEYALFGLIAIGIGITIAMAIFNP